MNRVKDTILSLAAFVAEMKNPVPSKGETEEELEIPAFLRV